jgi:hypothetical protein
MLRKEALNGQEIAKNAHAFFAGLSALREFRSSRNAAADEREYFEFNSGFEGCRPLKTVQSVEDNQGIGFVCGHNPHNIC